MTSIRIRHLGVGFEVASKPIGHRIADLVRRDSFINAESMKRLRPILIRLSGKAARKALHSGSACFHFRGTGCTRAARKFERKLAQVLGVRSC